MNQDGRCVVILGKESVGKSQLITSLTGRPAYVSNFRGATVNCETYQVEGWTFIDTPGILRRSDTLTTRLALEQLAHGNKVLLVAQATHLDEDLADLLPLVQGRQGSVVITFWDKVRSESAAQTIENLSQNAGLSLIPVDARSITPAERNRILEAVTIGQPIKLKQMQVRAGWRVAPTPTLLEHRLFGPFLGCILLLLPAFLAVWAANTFAGFVDPIVQAFVASAVELKNTVASPLKEIIFGNYGLLTMGPLLFVWSVPTVMLFALLLGSYKASGLIDRITVSIHPLIRPFGLTGRDFVRVVMGYGCNVPAVINTRACSSCSRGTCISAIAFGSACSYQLGATLSVFAAAGRPHLIIPYLFYLSLTTLLYSRLIAPRASRSALNVLMIEGRTFLQFPRLQDIWRESRKTLLQFFRNAIPIFFLITVLASVLDWLKLIDRLSLFLSPFMRAFNLPSSAALPVLLASIRKDGILLFARQDAMSAMSSHQILTGVYLAGVLLPCLVTLLTIWRESSVRFALKLLVRQVFFALCFSFILAWTGTLFTP